MTGALPAGKKKKDGPREHAENRKEIPASISLGREGIKRDRPILELTDQGIYFGSVCTLCTLFSKRVNWCTYFPLDKLLHCS